MAGPPAVSILRILFAIVTSGRSRTSLGVIAVWRGVGWVGSMCVITVWGPTLPAVLLGEELLVGDRTLISLGEVLLFITRVVCFLGLVIIVRRCRSRSEISLVHCRVNFLFNWCGFALSELKGLEHNGVCKAAVTGEGCVQIMWNRVCTRVWLHKLFNLM